MISEERLTLALTYLATTDRDLADLRAEVLRSEYLVKTQRQFAFLAAEGNNEERKASAETSGKVIEAQEHHVGAVANYERIRAKRETESLVIDVWRSENANRRQGQI